VSAPTNAGSYAVQATVQDANYSGGASGILSIGKGLASIVLSDLTQTYNSSPRVVTTTTTPPVSLGGLSVTYNGSPTAPVNAGSYSVVGSLTNPNYAASNVTGNFTIDKAGQAIIFVAHAR
jgi:hypothetical protein